MRRVYCDCCQREIRGGEQIFSAEIKRGHDEEIILNDMCVDCYTDIRRIVDMKNKKVLKDRF